jgi:hypothetical protein
MKSPGENRLESRPALAFRPLLGRRMARWRVAVWALAFGIQGVFGIAQEPPAASEQNARDPSWTAARAPAGTDPELATRLRVERAAPGAWLGNRQLECAYDPVTGAVLVGTAFDALAVWGESLFGARVVGNELRIYKSQARANAEADYARARDAALRDRSGAGETLPAARTVDLERLFGVDVAFSAKAGRPWGAVARVSRMSASGASLRVDLDAISGRSLQVVFNEQLAPISTAVDGRPGLILDAGFPVAASDIRSGKAAQWNAPEVAPLMTAAGAREAIVRAGTIQLSPGTPEGPTPLVMAVDPQDGALLTRWERGGPWRGRGSISDSGILSGRLAWSGPRARF